MTEQMKYQVNPLEKIEKIEDRKVRELCEKAVEEAIKMTERSDSTATISQRLSNIIEINSSRLAKED